MTIETEVASLTQATTDLLSAVNVKKAALDAAEANAVNALDSFESQYIGARSSAPATDADGDPVQTGALYYNTTNTTMYVYSGSAWAALVDNLVIDPNATMLSNIATNGNDIKFGDNDKATFGASDDLQIYHDGSHSYIKDSGTGILYVQGSGQVRVGGSDGTTGVEVNEGGDVKLRYNNSNKLATTSTGVDVTGTITSDGLTVDGAVDSAPLVISTAYGTAGEKYSAIRFNNKSFAGGDSEIRNVVNGASSVGSALEFHTEHTGAGDLRTRLNIDNNGDVSFYEDTGTTAKMVWSSGGERLDLSGTQGSQLRLDARGGSGTYWEFDSLYGTSNPQLNIKNNSLTAMSINSSGNVGIGTASPSTTLELSKASGWHGVKVTSGGQSLSLLHSGSDASIENSANGATRFYTNGSERARIDSSGNLLVGTTSQATWDSTVGTSIRANAATTMTASSGNPLYLNRLSNDGDLITFHRGSTAKVGSIGAQGSELTISGGTGRSGLRMHQSTILPLTNSSLSDATESLGQSNYRFKDLHLSGGVYLGGTGAANKLDDYETGAFIPTLSASTTSDFTYSVNDGHYVKVGDLVYFTAFIALASKGASSGNIELSGLPFLQADNLSGTSIESGLTFSYWSSITAQSLIGYVNGSGNTCILRKILSGNTSATEDAITSADIGNAFSVRIQGTYIAQ